MKNNDDVNLLIYGIKVTKFTSNNKRKHPRIFYIHENDMRYL